MIAVAFPLKVMLLSLIVVRVAAVALTLTGVSREVTGFQAHFRLDENRIHRHRERVSDALPVRRQIISTYASA
jgi:hypothetical protein